MKHLFADGIISGSIIGDQLSKDEKLSVLGPIIGDRKSVCSNKATDSVSLGKT